MLRSTTRQIASEQMTFAMLDSCRPRWPWSRTHAVCQGDEPALVDVHLVVGEHETDALVLTNWLAEGRAPPRVIGRDVVGAARGAEPAHAMRQARRREPHLRIAETFTDPARTWLSCTRNPSEPDDCMTPVMYWSSVSSTRSM